MDYLLIVLIITEVFVRFVEIIKPPPCDLQSSSILSNLSTSELADICNEYNRIEFDFHMYTNKLRGYGNSYRGYNRY